MIFDPIVLAKGWLSVAIASGDDKFRPALHRSICIEQFSDGVRLVATDSYVLLRAWVPGAEDPDAQEPDLDVAPIYTAVAIDEHRRAKGLLEHLLKLGEKEEAGEVRITLGQLGAARRQTTLGGMEVLWVAIEHPGHERVELVTYEGQFPTWRALVAGFRPEQTPAIALSNYVVAKLAKLTKLWGAHSIRVHFGGVNRMARVEIAESYPSVEGAAMPVKWDFDRNEPRVDAAAEPEDDGGEDLNPDDDIDAAESAGRAAEMMERARSKVMAGAEA
jgi:hypothetical protein